MVEKAVNIMQVIAFKATPDYLDSKAAYMEFLASPAGQRLLEMPKYFKQKPKIPFGPRAKERLTRVSSLLKVLSEEGGDFSKAFRRHQKELEKYNRKKNNTPTSSTHFLFRSFEEGIRELHKLAWAAEGANDKLKAANIRQMRNLLAVVTCKTQYLFQYSEDDIPPDPRLDAFMETKIQEVAYHFPPSKAAQFGR